MFFFFGVGKKMPKETGQPLYTQYNQEKDEHQRNY